MLNIRNYFWIIATTLAITLSICLFSSEVNPVIIVAFAFIAFVLVLIASLMLKSLRELQEKKQFEEELVNSLYSFSYYKALGIPTGTVLTKVLTQAKSARVKRVLLDLRNRIKMGETFLNAVGSLRSKADLTFLDKFDRSGSERDSILKTLRAYEAEAVEKATVQEISLQRYATANMFLSTILPSFVIFIFIGEMLLSETEGSVLPFSITMMLLLPFAYLTGNVLMRRRLIG